MKALRTAAVLALGAVLGAEAVVVWLAIYRPLQPRMAQVVSITHGRRAAR